MRRRALAVSVRLALLFTVGAAACVGELPTRDSEGTGGSGTGAAATGGAGGGAGAATGPTGSGGDAGRATGGGVVGQAGGGGGPATGGSGGDGPARLVIFYTRWGTSYPEWLPVPSGGGFSLGPIMAPLTPFQNKLFVINGLTNANIYMDSSGTVLRGADANDPGDAMITLLTGDRAPVGGPAGGPSLDTWVGNRPGALGPPLRLAVGQFGFDDNPGVCFGADGTAIRGERDPNAAGMRVLGHSVHAPDPIADIDGSYPALGAAQIGVAVEALAMGKTDTVVLMWGDHVVPRWLGLTQDIHTLSHLTSGAYTALSTPMPPSNPAGDFQKLQTWYAQQFALLLDQMSRVPVGAGSLLDQSVVLWISESGTGSDHQGYFIPVVMAGSGGGRLQVGVFMDLKSRPVPADQLQTVIRTQGDLLSALARIWVPAPFGDPAIARQPLAIFKQP